MENKNFFQQVYDLLKQVPSGKVVTYGQVARLIGHPRMSRQVGFALHSNPEPFVIPCHRVIFADGSLTKGFAFGGVEVQKSLLENEGVVVDNDYKVDLKKYQWQNGITK